MARPRIKPTSVAHPVMWVVRTCAQSISESGASETRRHYLIYALARTMLDDTAVARPFWPPEAHAAAITGKKPKPWPWSAS